MPSLLVVTLPVLLTTPVSGQSRRLHRSWAEVMCTVKSTPPGSSRGHRHRAAGQDTSRDRAGAVPARTLRIDRPGQTRIGRQASFSVTPWASPLPSFQTVIVKPIGSPTFTDAASAVFRMWIAGALTQIAAESSSDPSLVVVTSRCCRPVRSPRQSPPVAAVVPETMCTVKVLAAWVVPAGTVTGPQDRTPARIAQVLFQPAPCDSIDQSRPAFVGNVSLSVTPWASPLPEFQTVIVKPICSPAFTCAASAVFTIWIAGAATQIAAVVVRPVVGGRHRAGVVDQPVSPDSHRPSQPSSSRRCAP